LNTPSDFHLSRSGTAAEFIARIDQKRKGGSNEESVCNRRCVDRCRFGCSCARTRRRFRWCSVQLLVARPFVPDQRSRSRDDRRIWIFSRPSDADQWTSNRLARSLRLCTGPCEALRDYHEAASSWRPFLYQAQLASALSGHALALLRCPRLSVKQTSQCSPRAWADPDVPAVSKTFFIRLYHHVIFAAAARDIL
jgi:hypothetical protein